VNAGRPFKAGTKSCRPDEPRSDAWTQPSLHDEINRQPQNSAKLCRPFRACFHGYVHPGFRIPLSRDPPPWAIGCRAFSAAATWRCAMQSCAAGCLEAALSALQIYVVAGQNQPCKGGTNLHCIAASPLQHCGNDNPFTTESIFPVNSGDRATSRLRSDTPNVAHRFHRTA
jgi:hypothetical protein